MRSPSRRRKWGAYEDIINKAFELGIPVATFNSFDPTIPYRSQISHTGQSSSAASIAGEGIVKCLLDGGVEKGMVLMPNSTTLGNVEVNERVQYAAKAIREGLEKAGVTGITVDDGQGIGIDVRPTTADATQDIINLIESTPDVCRLVWTKWRAYSCCGECGSEHGHERSNLFVWI